MSGDTKLETSDLNLTPREAFTVIQFIEGWMLDSNNKPTSKHAFFLSEISTRLERLNLEDQLEQFEEILTMKTQEYNELLGKNKVTPEDFRNRPMKPSSEKHKLLDTDESRKPYDMPVVLRRHIKACVIKTNLQSGIGYKQIVRVRKELNIADPSLT